MVAFSHTFMYAQIPPICSMAIFALTFFAFFFFSGFFLNSLIIIQILFRMIPYIIFYQFFFARCIVVQNILRRIAVLDITNTSKKHHMTSLHKTLSAAFDALLITTLVVFLTLYIVCGNTCAQNVPNLESILLTAAIVSFAVSFISFRILTNKI